MEHGPPKCLKTNKGKKFREERGNINECFVLLRLWGPSWNYGGNLLTGQNTTAQNFRHLGKLHPTKILSDKSLDQFCLI